MENCGCNGTMVEETITITQDSKGTTTTDTIRIYEAGPGLDIPLLDDYSDMGG